METKYELVVPISGFARTTKYFYSYRKFTINDILNNLTQKLYELGLGFSTCDFLSGLLGSNDKEKVSVVFLFPETLLESKYVEKTLHANIFFLTLYSNTSTPDHEMCLWGKKGLINKETLEIIRNNNNIVDFKSLSRNFFLNIEKGQNIDSPIAFILRANRLRTKENPFYSLAFEVFTVTLVLYLCFHHARKTHKECLLDITLTKEAYDFFEGVFESSLDRTAWPDYAKIFRKRKISSNRNSVRLILILDSLYIDEKWKKFLQYVPQIKFEQIFEMLRFYFNKDEIFLKDPIPEIKRPFVVIDHRFLKTWLLTDYFFEDVTTSEVSDELKLFLLKKTRGKISDPNFQIIKFNDLLVSARKENFNFALVRYIPYKEYLFVPNTKMAILRPTENFQLGIENFSILISPLKGLKLNKHISFQDVKQLMEHIYNLIINYIEITKINTNEFHTSDVVAYNIGRILKYLYETKNLYKIISSYGTTKTKAKKTHTKK